MFTTMYWHLMFCIFSLHASKINGQRRALVYYHQTSTDEPDPFSENPLSSSINSIQTGREELIASHKGDTGLGEAYRRGYHKTTTPPYFKDPLKGDNTNTGKNQSNSSSISNRNGTRSRESQIGEVPRENRHAEDTIRFNDKRSTGMEVPPSGTIRSDITLETGRSSQRKDRDKEGMDINKSIPSREQDRRSNTQESRRHTTTPSLSSNAKFNSSVRDGAEKHREELSEKGHGERGSKERRSTPAPENTRGHRPATRSTSDKGEILTQPTSRIPASQRYDRSEQPSISSGTHDRKAPDRHLDSRDPLRSVDEKKKDLDVELDLGDKAYSTGNEDRSKPRDNQTDSADPNKPTHEEEKLPEPSRNPADGYRDEFTAGEKVDMNGKVGSDIEKSLGAGEGKTYAEGPYSRDDEERSPGHHARDTDRGYTRRHRDRYDERSYDERLPKSGQSRRGQERNAGYDSRDRTGGRTSRPRDRSYDEEYRDVYSTRDTVKSSDNSPKDRTRSGRRPQTGISDDVDDRDRHPVDGTRNYRDYSGDDRYRDDRGPTDRDTRRRYRDEDNRKYSDESNRRTSYDDGYEEGDTYRDDYRYEKDGESRRYRDDVTRRYTTSGSRRYDEEEEGRRPADYERPAPRYKDDEEYKYNSTHRYRDSYDVYKDDNRRSSGDSVGSHRYDERDGTRGIRYDEEEYKGGRSYTNRDNDQKYVRRDHEDTFRQRDITRKYATDDVTRYRGDEEDRFRDEPRTYSGGGSSRDSYDQSNRRLYEGDRTTYIGTRTYQERSETDTRRDYDDMNRRNGSRRTHGDGSYSSYPYAEDEYYNNRTSTGYADRYDGTDRPTRRTDDDYSGFDGDDRKYASRSSEERRRDRTYVDIPSSRRRSDVDGTRRLYEDRRSDRDRADTYDERTYRNRDDEYIRGSRGRDYDVPTYRDSDDEIDTRKYRGREDVDINDRYKGDDTIRDRATDDEIKNPRPVSGRNRDKSYSDRTHEDQYRDRNSEGTYRYREDDDRYRYTSSEDRTPEYRDSEKRSKGTQRTQDDYDTSYGRDSNTPRTTDDRHRAGSKSNRREDRLAGDRADLEDKAPDSERSSSKADPSLRSDTKTEFTDRRGDESLSKGDRSDYDEERRRDRRRSQPRDVQPSNTPPKTRASAGRPDSLEKGDFGRGRRTFYNEDDKTDSDREERAKVSKEDRRLPRTDGDEDLSYARNEKDRGSSYNARDSRQNGKSNAGGNSEGRSYSNRRESSDTSRHRTSDEIHVSRMPLDSLPASDDVGYSDRKEDAANPTISQTDQGPQKTYSSSSIERGGRRQLPSIREPDVDRPPRKEESEDSSLPENRGGYRYTKSRGDRDDFDRQAEERSFTVRDEYNPRGVKSSKGLDADRSDTLKGEYGSPGSGTPTRNKQDRIPDYSDHQSKDEYYTPVRDKTPSHDGKLVDDSPERRDSDRRDKVVRDSTGRDERGMYENGEYYRSSSQEELKFVGENITRDNEDARSNKENDYSTLSVVFQAAPGGRTQGSTISRSATPIPHYQDKELITRNVSSKNISDKFSGSSIYREKRFQYDDRYSTNNTSRSAAGMNDELSKRPLTTKEVIDAAYRHSDDPEKQREIFYPVYVPGSGNMTSPDVIRPSERRGITTPTKKKKKK